MHNEKRSDMKKGYLLILLGAALFVGAVFAQVDNSGARPMGAGGAFVAVADDANAALWNPAGMEGFRNMALTLSYSRLYLGVQDDGLNDGYLGFVNHLGRYGRYGSFGISYSQFFAGVYREGIFTLGYAKRLFGAQNSANLSLGLNGKMVWIQANEAGFSDDFEAGDPVVSTTSKFVPSADVGLMLNAAKWLSLGVCAADILLFGYAACCNHWHKEQGHYKISFHKNHPLCGGLVRYKIGRAHV